MGWIVGIVLFFFFSGLNPLAQLPISEMGWWAIGVYLVYCWLAGVLGRWRERRLRSA